MNIEKNTEKTNSSKKQLIMVTALFIISLLFMIIAIVPSFRNKAKKYLAFSERKIIAKTSGELTLHGPEITAIKLFEEGKLYIEFYQTQNETGIQAQIGKIHLTDNKDGFFLFQGNSTNLAMYDTDGDGNLEVVAPTFDLDNNPRLNVFKFNPDTNRFERTGP